MKYIFASLFLFLQFSYSARTIDRPPTLSDKEDTLAKPLSAYKSKWNGEEYALYKERAEDAYVVKNGYDSVCLTFKLTRSTRSLKTSIFTHEDFTVFLLTDVEYKQSLYSNDSKSRAECCALCIKAYFTDLSKQVKLPKFFWFQPISMVDYFQSQFAPSSQNILILKATFERLNFERVTSGEFIRDVLGSINSRGLLYVLNSQKQS